MVEEFVDEQGSLIQVAENFNFDHYQRMFPFQASGSGRILRLQAAAGVNPPAEVRLMGAAATGSYDQIVCGMFWHRDQGYATAFPLTVPVRQKAIWMTCQHVSAGRWPHRSCLDARRSLVQGRLTSPVMTLWAVCRRPKTHYFHRP